MAVVSHALPTSPWTLSQVQGSLRLPDDQTSVKIPRHPCPTARQLRQARPPGQGQGDDQGTMLQELAYPWLAELKQVKW